MCKTEIMCNIYTDKGAILQYYRQPTLFFDTLSILIIRHTFVIFTTRPVSMQVESRPQLRNLSWNNKTQISILSYAITTVGYVCMYSTSD